MKRRSPAWKVAAFVTGSVFSAMAFAQTTGTSTMPVATPITTPIAPPASPMASMMPGLVGLVIVVGLIYAAAWLLKRVGPRARSSGIVQVLGGASVGPREKVVVVRFAGETLLLGVASGHVSLLHTAVDGVGGPVDDTTPSAPRFIDRLRAARSGT